MTAAAAVLLKNFRVFGKHFSYILGEVHSCKRCGLNSEACLMYKKWSPRGVKYHTFTVVFYLIFAPKYLFSLLVTATIYNNNYLR